MARYFAEQFGHKRFGVAAFGQKVSVPAMRGRDVIVAAQHGTNADGNRFLPGVKMRCTFDNARREKIIKPFFKAPNQKHHAQLRQQFVLVSTHVWLRV
jgi:hypothetical protein